MISGVPLPSFVFFFLKESGNICLGSGKLSFVHLSIGSDHITPQPESNLRGLRSGKEDLKISWAEHGSKCILFMEQEIMR